MRIAIIVLLSVICQAYTLQNRSKITYFDDDSDCSKNIEVELVEFKPYEAGCGDVIFSYMFKYKIIKWNSKNNQDEYVYVIHKCIELKGKGFFVLGGRYKIKVKPVQSPEKYLKESEGKDTYVNVKYVNGKVYYEEEISLLHLPDDKERSQHIKTLLN